VLTFLLERPHPIVVMGRADGRMSPFQLCRALRRVREGRRAYVIVLLDDEARMADAFDAGADDVVLRPLEPGDIVMAVRRGERISRLSRQVDEDAALQRKQLARLAVLNRKLRAMALLDEPTQLPNRRLAEARLRDVWAASKVHLAALLVNVDFAGGVDVDRDSVLRAIAEELHPILTNHDTLARFRGQTLLILRPEANAVEAEELAEEVRERVRTLIQRVGLGEVSIAVGVATRDFGVTSPDALCRAADAAAR
jgi:diguanylate cyclase (GGDEF)-like protein